MVALCALSGKRATAARARDVPTHVRSTAVESPEKGFQRSPLSSGFVAINVSLLSVSYEGEE